MQIRCSHCARVFNSRRDSCKKVLQIYVISVLIYQTVLNKQVAQQILRDLIQH
jgi:hypothetical protein